MDASKSLLCSYGWPDVVRCTEADMKISKMGRPKKKNKQYAKISIYCPYCGKQHIDKGWYAAKPHREHLCFGCNKRFSISRPTIGVANGSF